MLGSTGQRYNGIYRGIVTDTNTSTNTVKVKIPQLFGEKKTDWVPLVLPHATLKETPVTNQPVFIVFESGDPSYPICIGECGYNSNERNTPSGLRTYIRHFYPDQEDVQDIDCIKYVTDNEDSDFDTQAFDIVSSVVCIAKKNYSLSHPPYGSFYDTTQQAATSTNTGYGVKLNTTDAASEMSIDPIDTSKIIIDKKGIYNLQFSLEMHNTGGGGPGTNAWVWLKVNGTDVPWSNTLCSINTNSPYVVAAWNFIFTAPTDNSYVNLMWATDNTHIVIEKSNPNAFSPAIPSAIVTITQQQAL
jgi:hypothetical protein